VENGGEDRNSLVDSPGEHMRMVTPEVGKHRGGASTAGYKSLVAVHAGRFVGDRVVICPLEVIPRWTSTWTASVATMWQGDQNVGRGNRRAGSLEGRQRALRSGIAIVGSNVNDVIGIPIHFVGIHFHGSTRKCNRWWVGEGCRGGQKAV
jgi:hypothetical protein